MAELEKTIPSFPDHNQRFWALASIQAATLGWAGTLIGGSLAATLGLGAALTSIVIGNLLLWMVGFTIISMTASSRDNAIQNVNRFLGKVGGAAAALFLIIAFLSWYILQLNSMTSTIQAIFSWDRGSLRLGAAFGFLVALLASGGIFLIKRLCVVVFPLLCVLVIYLLINASVSFDFDGLWHFSFYGIIVTVASTLAGMINLPTFFRHSRSRADSYLGLSLMTVFTMLFQIFPIFCGYSDFASLRSEYFTINVAVVAFSVLSLVSTNSVNIYFASAGWEMIFPHRVSGKEYVIVGLLGTMAYTFLQVSAPMSFLENMANNFIASLGAVLLLAFLMTIVVRHRLRPFEKIINVSCWFFGGIVGTCTQVHLNDPTYALVVSIGASCILFITILFFEETSWALKRLLLRLRR